MNIFVGCASRDTTNSHYNKTAEEIANFIVKGKHNFVFGGCDVGLMGKIYSLVSKSVDSQVIVAITKAYEFQLKNLIYDNVYTFETVNERKNCLLKLADVIVIIPGGIGTIDEFLTAIEAKRAHEHNIPVIVVNTDNYFGPILDMLNQIYGEGFAEPKNRELYCISDTWEDAIKHLSELTETK